VFLSCTFPAASALPVYPSKITTKNRIIVPASTGNFFLSFMFFPPVQKPAPEHFPEQVQNTFIF